MINSSSYPTVVGGIGQRYFVQKIYLIDGILNTIHFSITTIDSECAPETFLKKLVVGIDTISFNNYDSNWLSKYF